MLHVHVQKCIFLLSVPLCIDPVYFIVASYYCLCYNKDFIILGRQTTVYCLLYIAT